MYDQLRTSLVLFGFVFTSLLGFGSLPATASCANSSSNDSPAFGADRQLWGELRPMDIGQLPANRDNSDFDQFGNWEANPYYLSLDIENDWLFVAANRRFQIWNTNPDPGQPQLTGDLSLTLMDLQWGADAHAFLAFNDVDAPPGRDDLVAMAGDFGIGLVLFDTSNKALPKVIYHDSGPGDPPQRRGSQVYSTVIDGRSYAFVAVASSPGGVLAYDLDAANALYASEQETCFEQDPEQDCTDVFLGAFGPDKADFLDGSGDYLVTSNIGDTNGIRIWDVSNPSSPSLRMDALSNDPVWGVALWQDGANYYLAARLVQEKRIYDVTCITQGSCSLGNPLWSEAAGFPSADGSGTVTQSWSDTTPLLYWGGHASCPSGSSELLQDVSNPAAPRDIAPPNTITDGNETITYWSWYYPSHSNYGYFEVQPRAGKFHGPYFYRAAFSVLDTHLWTTAVPPVADFTISSDPAFVGRDVDLTDTSLGLPNSWSWSFSPDASPATSSTPDPTTTFSSAGTKTVSLEVQNASGSDTKVVQLEVQNPEPATSGIAASATVAQVCQTLTFTAQDVTGEPPLTIAWEVFDDQNQSVTTHSGNPFIWKTPVAVPAGTYTVQVTVSNNLGNAVETLEIQLEAPAGGLQTIFCDAFELGNLDAWSAVL